MGVIVNYHYCMGKLASVKLKLVADDGCGCGTKKKMKCCHDDLKIFKISDKQQLAVADLKFAQSDMILQPFFVLNDAINNEHSFIALHYNSPPLQRSNEIFLYNCVFRL